MIDPPTPLIDPQGTRYFVDPADPTIRFGDGDADTENTVFGQNGGGAAAQRGAILFLESLTDYARQRGWTGAQAAVHQQRVLVHEVGHQFNLMPGGGREDNPPGLDSIMNYRTMNDLTVTAGFVAVQLHGLRSTLNPGR